MEIVWFHSENVFGTRAQLNVRMPFVTMVESFNFHRPLTIETASLLCQLNNTGCGIDTEQFCGVRRRLECVTKRRHRRMYGIAYFCVRCGGIVNVNCCDSADNAVLKYIAIYV